MSDLENLQDTLDAWREGVKISRQESGEVAPQNPYGQQIYDLNMEWARIRKENEERIADQKRRYEKRANELEEASRRWRRDHPHVNPGRGRPKNPDYSDGVKMAAAKLYRSSRSLTLIRTAMGIGKTAILNRVLEEGEALLKKQEEEEW